jgi:uncharacterized protein YndB with AHSA1/START domain
MTMDPDSRTVVMEREMAHPPEKVWRALTQSALMQEWLMTNDFQPVVGHRFNLRTQPMPQWDGVLDCEVLTVEPCTALSYTWNTTSGGLRTVVSWTLTPTGKGTLLRMEQSGFRPEEENNYQGAKYGWPRFLAALEQVVSLLD